MIVLIIACAMIQASVGAFVAVSSAGDFHASLKNPEAYAQDMPGESRMVKIGLALFFTAPLAILSVPIAAVVAAGYGIMKLAQFFMPALKYDGSQM